MTEPNTPIEWGVLAASIPGWHFPWETASDSKTPAVPPRGHVLLQGQWVYQEDMAAAADFYSPVPDVDYWAWQGWLLRLLAPHDISAHMCSPLYDGPYFIRWHDPADPDGDPLTFSAPSIGRCCVLLAQHLGRWPGGDS